MTRSVDERVWSRVTAGRHTAVLGAGKLQPPASIWLLRASCDVPKSTLGPIVDAQRKAAQVLGDQTAIFEQARDMLVTGLRRRFLGTMQERGPATARLVEACYRLSRQDRRYALLFDAVDAADDATLDALTRLVERPDALALPLILVFRDHEPAERSARLLVTMREVHGDESVLERPRPAQRESQESAAFDWRVLPFDVLQVLRAGAVIGSGFEAELLAELLECSPLDVLDCVQQAADAGAPIEDRGEGRFFLPESEMDSLLDSLLPSLEAAWHRRLGWLLAADDEDHDEDTTALDGSPWIDIRDSQDEYRPPARVREDTVVFARDLDRPLQASVEGLDYDDAAVTLERVPIQSPRFAEVFINRADAEPDTADDAASALEDDALDDQDDALDAEDDALDDEDDALEDDALDDDALDDDDAPGDDGSGDAAETVARPPVQEPGAPSSARSVGDASLSSSERVTVREIPSRPRPRASTHDGVAGARYRDPARAASHLSASGQLEAAAKKYAVAAAEAAATGAYEQAMEHGKQALTLIESLPDTAERRHFRAEMLTAMGRLQWQAGMLDGHPDPTFSLSRALDTADLARSLLRDDDPAQLQAEAHSLVAGICYDLGTPKALERALDELTRAAQLLLSENRVIGAARLLNDQAAVYVRLGDPVRASHLLSESQKIFEARTEGDPVAMRELAETHHLLARLPLHAPIRQGREAEAYEMAIEHASMAENRYRELGDTREIARTWETRARIELMRGHLEEAMRYLHSALDVQSRIIDLTGLARSTAALSDVLAASHRYAEALTVLGNSIDLNQEKGSPIGLAFNRRALDRLERAISRSGTKPDSELARTLAGIAGQLESAERGLGRVTLPGEP